VKERSRILFVNRFYWPDSSATAQILTELAEALAERGYHVTIACSRLSYADPEDVYPVEEKRRGVHVRRLPTTRFGRGSLPGRLMDYLSFYFSVVIYLLQRAESRDTVVLKTDPPLLSLVGYLAGRIKGFRMVNWCQDLFPEIAAHEFGLQGLAGYLSEAVAKFRDISLSASEAVVVLGEDMEAYLKSRGAIRGNACRINNWSVQPAKENRAAPDLRAEWGIPETAFVFGYSGNLGRAHDWQTVLEAAGLLVDDKRLWFVCVGGGAGYKAMQTAVEREGLSERFRFLPYQPLERLEATLRVPDLHWLTLKTSLTPYIFPSKFYGILQAGRPAVFIGRETSQIADLLVANKAGGVVAEGDGKGLVRVIRSYLDDPDRARREGSNGRRLWERAFRKELAFSQWEEMLAKVTGA